MARCLLYQRDQSVGSQVYLVRVLTDPVLPFWSQQSVSQLAREKAEKDELMRMCNQLLLELEAVKGAQAQRAR